MRKRIFVPNFLCLFFTPNELESGFIHYCKKIFKKINQCYVVSFQISNSATIFVFIYVTIYVTHQSNHIDT